MLNIKLTQMARICTLLTLCILSTQLTWAQQGPAFIKGLVTYENGEPVSTANIILEGSTHSAYTDEAGTFEINAVPAKTYQIRVYRIGCQSITQTIALAANETLDLRLTLSVKANQITEVEVFGDRERQPEKLDAITRLPLKPSDQIQSISIVSEKLIEKQGALTIAEATRNVPGVYTYARYGGARESMSSRGFRGLPILKNGVRVHSDFRGTGFMTDMQGVESIQILKGANSITMGAATDLGAPGGIINIVTKTPKFENSGYASLRIGSWGQVRPAFDVQGVLNEAQTLAFRLNGAYETADGFRKGTSLEKFYINPSLEWRPDSKTTVTVEMDYLNDSRTLDVGTVNLAPGNKTNQIYELGDKFLGFTTDRSMVENATFAARFKRDLTNNLYLRGAFFHSKYDSEGIKAGLSAVRPDPENNINVGQVNIFNRSLQHNQDRLDKNSVFQLDLVGIDLETGPIKHTFQLGFDYRATNLFMPVFNTIAIDQINVLQPVSNTLPEGTPSFTQTGETQSKDNSIGLTAQDVIQVTNWAKVFVGGRYSTYQSTNPEATGATRTSYWNPLGGFMIAVKPGLNLFGSYTNSTNPRTAAVADVNGNALGNERIDQLEAGIKSDWLNNRLRFNLTLYKINNRNMNLRATEVDPATGIVVLQDYYIKGGNDERKGAEVELAGRILPNLEIMAGYAYIDAQYKEHTTFVPGSAPNNTPRHTFNAWTSYTVEQGILRGLNLGAGVYHLGKRPYNDFTQPDTYYHDIQPDTKPWYNKAYTTVNAQLGYEFKKHFGIRLLFNNILNEVGFDAYRTSFIDQITPRNFNTVVTYRF